MVHKVKVATAFILTFTLCTIFFVEECEKNVLLRISTYGQSTAYMIPHYWVVFKHKIKIFSFFLR